jgi:hypothetical protein
MRWFGCTVTTEPFSPASLRTSSARAPRPPLLSRAFTGSPALISSGQAPLPLRGMSSSGRCSARTFAPRGLGGEARSGASDQAVGHLHLGSTAAEQANHVFVREYLAPILGGAGPLSTGGSGSLIEVKTTTWAGITRPYRRMSVRREVSGGTLARSGTARASEFRSGQDKRCPTLLPFAQSGTHPRETGVALPGGSTARRSPWPCSYSYAHA